MLNLIRSLFTRSNSAQQLYDRAVAAAELGDLLAAYQHYTNVIGMQDVEVELLSMALVNRALVCSRLAQVEQALADLQTVLGMPGAPSNVKAAAREKLARVENKQRRAQPR